MKKLIKKLLGYRDPEESQRKYLLENGMEMGENCHIYSYNGIDAGKPYLITIGDNVTISTNVTILTHDASPNVVGCGTKLGKVKIGSNVFIGTRAVVLCNVKIGDNVVVGAGSVVTRDLPGDAVYAGSPARKICTIEEYRKKYEEMREKCPHIDEIRPWNTWDDAPLSDRKKMSDLLENSAGFF